MAQMRCDQLCSLTIRVIDQEVTERFRETAAGGVHAVHAEVFCLPIVAMADNHWRVVGRICRTQRAFDN